MTLKKIISLCIIAIAILLIYLFFFSKNHKRIESAIGKCVTQIEQHESLQALSFVSDKYTDSYGLNREAIKGMLFALSQKCDSLDISFTISSIEVSDSRASVQLSAQVDAIFFGNKENIIGKEGYEEPLRADLEKEGIFWRVKSVEWLNHTSLRNLIQTPYLKILL